jgi:hypothetical protein
MVGIAGIAKCHYNQGYRTQNSCVVGVVNALTGRLITGLAPADRTLPRAVVLPIRVRDRADTYV